MFGAVNSHPLLWLSLFQDVYWLLRCKFPSSGVHKVSNSLNCKQSCAVLSHFCPPFFSPARNNHPRCRDHFDIFFREWKLWRWGLICNAAKAQISSEVPPLGRQTLRDRFVPLCLLCIPARSWSAALVARIPSNSCPFPNTATNRRVASPQLAVPQDNPPVIKSCGFCLLLPFVRLFGWTNRNWK